MLEEPATTALSPARCKRYKSTRGVKTSFSFSKDKGPGASGDKTQGAGNVQKGRPFRHYLTKRGSSHMPMNDAVQGKMSSRESS